MSMTKRIPVRTRKKINVKLKNLSRQRLEYARSAFLFLHCWLKRIAYPVSVLVLSACLCSGLAAHADLLLTRPEQAWLKAHPVIRFAVDPDFVPFEWVTENGEYRGMAADYLALVEKKLDVHFKRVRTDSWLDAMSMIRKHQIDMLPALARSPQREKYLLFTPPHIIIPGVLISAKNYHSIEQLEDKKVVVVGGYVWDDLIGHHRTDVHLIRVENTHDGMELTALGAVDGMVSDLASVAHAMREGAYSNLHIVSYLPHRLELGFAVRGDWFVLRDILTKALDSLTGKEKQTITEKWLTLDRISFWHKPAFWYSVLSGMGVLLLILGVVLIWNRILKHQVILRTRALENAQMQLIHAEKMESIGRLAAGVAHEVKNPLAIIQMASDFLAQEVVGNKEAHEVIRDIDNAVNRANLVIRGLLDFSRGEKLNMRPLNINEVIERALQLVTYDLRQHHVEVVTALSDDLPPMQIDSGKLQQVFVNLFMNAVQAMGSEGHLRISNCLYRIATEHELRRDREHHFRLGEEVILVEVADNGPGIHDLDQKKIFDPFFTSKPLGEGTGLGLSVSQNIISLHHGILDVRNGIDGGAVFTLIFKINKEPQQ